MFVPKRFGPLKGKFSQMKLEDVGLKVSEWVDKIPEDHPLVRRPKNFFKENSSRHQGYVRFSNPIVDSQKKIVFVGCGAASTGLIPYTMFNRPKFYQVWVIEPQFQRPTFFDSKIYDIFYFNDEKDFISTPQPLRKVIFPQGYGDIYWHRHPVTEILPDKRLIKTEGGMTAPYEFLCITSGAHPYFNEIEGLTETLGSNGVFSLYSDSPYHHFKFKNDLSKFRGGKIIYYTPSGKFSHRSTSASLVNLTFDKLSCRNIPDINIVHYSPEFYSIGDSFLDHKIREQWKENGIAYESNLRLISVDGPNKVATFENVETKQRILEKFDILHVTPPMAAIPAVRNSPLADSEGWLDVDHRSFHNKKYPNIFGWGSGTNLPVPKSYFSSLSQVENGISTIGCLIVCLGYKLLNIARARTFYNGEGFDVVHLGNRMVSTFGTKEGKSFHNQHFPYIWQSWDSQIDLKEFVDNYLDISEMQLYYNPDEVYQLLNKVYPMEPTDDIAEEWEQL